MRRTVMKTLHKLISHTCTRNVIFVFKHEFVLQRSFLSFFLNFLLIYVLISSSHRRNPLLLLSSSSIFFSLFFFFFFISWCKHSNLFNFPYFFHLFHHLPVMISEVFLAVWEIILFFCHMILRHRVMGSGRCQELAVP